MELRRRQLGARFNPDEHIPMQEIRRIYGEIRGFPYDPLG